MKNSSKQTFLGAMGAIFLLATTSVQAMNPDDQKGEQGAHTTTVKPTGPQQAQEQQNANPNGAAAAAAAAPQSAAVAGSTLIPPFHTQSYKEQECSTCKKTIRIDTEGRSWHLKRTLYLSDCNLGTFFQRDPGDVSGRLLETQEKMEKTEWTQFCPREEC